MNYFIEIKDTSKRSIGNKRLIYGVGINDAWYMVAKTIDGKKSICPYYQRWKNMLERCYSKKCQINQPTYIDCTVCYDWHTFSNFKKWMKHRDWHGKHLDKDILFIGNKLYSPETCVFVSSRVNLLLIDNAASRGSLPMGVYDMPSGRFRARCNIGTKSLKHIGSYDTITDASNACVEFKTLLITKIANEQIDEKIRKGLLNHATAFRDKYFCKNSLHINVIYAV